MRSKRLPHVRGELGIDAIVKHDTAVIEVTLVGGLLRVDEVEI